MRNPSKNSSSNHEIQHHDLIEILQSDESTLQSRQRAIEILFELYFEMFIGYATKLLKNCCKDPIQEAEDQVLILFTRLHKREFTPNEKIRSPKSWLYATLKNQCSNFCRKNKNRDRINREINPDDPDCSSGATVFLLDDDTKFSISKRIKIHIKQQIKSKIKLDIITHVLEGFSNPEIAEKINRTEGYVRRRKHEVIKALQGSIEGDEILRELYYE